MKKLKQTMWAIRDDKFVSGSIENTEKMAKEAFCYNIGEPPAMGLTTEEIIELWNDAVQRGYRCVKVEVREL